MPPDRAMPIVSVGVTPQSASLSAKDGSKGDSIWRQQETLRVPAAEDCGPCTFYAVCTISELQRRATSVQL